MAESCPRSSFTGVHGWAVEREERVADGQKALVTAVRCKFCLLPAPEEIAEREIERDRLNKKANQVAANIRRDSDAFKQMRKRR